MTGIDLLRAEMIKRGATRTMTESKTATMVLDILTEAGTTYGDLQEAKDQLQEAKNQLEGVKAKRAAVEMEIKRAREALKDLRETERHLRDEDCEYINKWLTALEEMESEEGRDRLRVAQIFANSCDVVTKYDNTAYIIGLASILSGGRIGAMDELKKINKRLPWMGEREKEPMWIF